MSAAHKKVIVRLSEGGLHCGYLPATRLSAAGKMELLLPDGRVLALELEAVKYIAYVRNFNLDDPREPERLTVRRFASKPRGGGLWVRLQFTDEETLEGLVHGGLSLLDSLLHDGGVFFEPPDRNGNTQRVFVPRSALVNFDVLGVAGSATAARRRVGAGKQQGALFGPPQAD